ncbi:MAG: hypothetical protein NTU66_02485 [Elusimicrobia bacterium]|nr:hypothetical protein [Elusimicrobiota bacterium]
MQLKLVMILCGALFLTGCGQEDVPITPNQIIKLPAINLKVTAGKSIGERYEYAGDIYRDPFMSINREGMSVSGTDEIVIPNIGSLKLKGLMSEGKQKIAILSNGVFGYVLKEKLLYDSRQRLIPGFTGIFKEGSVIIVAPDKSTKEIHLRER